MIPAEFQYAAPKTVSEAVALLQTNPDAKILVAGSTMQLVSKYRFNALREGYSVNKVTIVNDIERVQIAMSTVMAEFLQEFESAKELVGIVQSSQT